MFFFAEPIALVLALGSIVCGIVALLQNPVVSKLKGLAVAGIAVGAVSVLWNIFLLSL